jgi:hypothetical protein
MFQINISEYTILYLYTKREHGEILRFVENYLFGEIILLFFC